MTTYTRITCGCPIVRRCLRHLQDKALGLDQELVEELTQRGNPISDHPDLVKLRGFLAIEAMLKPIVHLYEMKYRRTGENQFYLQLTERTWIELTHLKIGLECLLDQVDIDLTEMQLGGTSFKGNTVHLAQGERATTGLRGLTAQRLKPLIEGLLSSIVALRPFLKNEEASVSCIGDRLSEALRGVIAAPLLDATTKLIEARL